MKKNNQRTLQLSRETIRNLGADRFARVAGGGGSMPTVYTCAGCPTNNGCTSAPSGACGGGGGGTDTGTGATITTTLIFL
jgi:hypothetical protein